jgi:hypothetical protein
LLRGRVPLWLWLRPRGASLVRVWIHIPGRKPRDFPVSWERVAGPSWCAGDGQFVLRVPSFMRECCAEGRSGRSSGRQASRPPAAFEMRVIADVVHCQNAVGFRPDRQAPASARLEGGIAGCWRRMRHPRGGRVTAKWALLQKALRLPDFACCHSGKPSGHMVYLVSVRAVALALVSSQTLTFLPDPRMAARAACGKCLMSGAGALCAICTGAGAGLPG